MTRGVGLAEWLSELPEVVLVLAAVLTQLGDLWFLTLVVTGGYWLGRHTPRLDDAVTRDRMVAVLGALVLGIALTETLKVIFGVPRPPWFVADPTLAGLEGPLATAYAWLAGAGGFGFPSGHAIATTVGWGGLAWAIRAGDRRHRVAIAAAVVTVVSLARLVLGLHFLVDVVAGVAVGLGALAVVLRSRPWPVLPFALATAVAVVGVAVAGLTTDTAGVVGLSIGVTGGWLLGGPAAVRSERAAGAGAAKLTTLLGVTLVLPPVAIAVLGPFRPVVTLLVAMAAGAALIVLPLVGVRVEEKIASWAA